jgi:hypothetical protein
MKNDTKSKLLGYMWQFLVVLGTSLAGYLTAGKEELTLPAKPTMTVSGAFLGLLGVWAWWSYLMWKELSKEEKVRRARQDGRNICDCVDEGVIMLVGSKLLNDARKKIMQCPKCGERQWRMLDDKGQSEV